MTRLRDFPYSPSNNSFLPSGRWLAVWHAVELVLAACGETTEPPPSVTSVMLTPDSATLEYVAETLQLSASAQDANGNPIPGKTFTWFSSDNSVATVSSSGLVTAVARGSVAITATADSTAGTAVVDVIVRFASMSAGRYHTCGVTARGTTYCWGDNSKGQLGDGSNTSSTRPVLVAGGQRFVKLARGSRDHTCGLTAGGEAYCWGQNGVGQLGDGTTVNRNQPVRSASTFTFASLDAGAYHTCALTGTGQAYCWGANGADGVNGRPLGAPTTQICVNPEAPYRGDSWPCSPNPVAVSGGLTYRSISSGVLATCGVALNSEASCWGWNILYQLGNGTDADATAPTLMAGGLRFDALALGGSHGCGLVSGQAHCWGAKSFSWGQLGTGSFQGSSTPASVVGGLTFTLVIPSSANNILSFTCGLTPAGAAYCWGTSRHGQLGTTSMLTPSCAVVNGADVPCSSVPVPVAGGVTFTTLALGEEFACGVDKIGAAFCWGRNDFGQLGDGTTADRNMPTPVVPLP